MKSFEYKVLIKEAYLDTFGHVNNAQYLTLFEVARWDMIHNRGYGLKEIQERGLGPVVLEVKIRYHKELKLRDQITIRTTRLANEPGRRNITMKLEQKMVNEKGEDCCTAEFTFGLFDLKARKLVPPTPEWLRAIGDID